MALHYYTPATRALHIDNMRSFYPWQADEHHSPFRADDFNLENVIKLFPGLDFDTYYKAPPQEVAFLTAYISRSVLVFTAPVFNAKDKTVSYFENQVKKEKGIRTSSKIGKFIRKVAPYFNDLQVEILTNIILEEFAEHTYTHKIGKTRKDFAEIYMTEAESGRNIGNYACLNASCMRHSFGEFHPTEVYASGDFELHYLMNEFGKIAARTLVCLHDMTYSYPYVSNTMAGIELEAKIRETYPDIRKTDEVSDSWDGAKLLKIETEPGVFLAPYMDNNCEADDDGDYFVLGGSTYSFCNTEGWIRARIKCECCGDTIYGPAVTTVEGETVGENCCANYCEYHEDWTSGPTETVIISLDKTWYGYIDTQQWSEDAAESYACYDEEEGNYFTKDTYEELLAKRQEEAEEEDDTEEAA